MKEIQLEEMWGKINKALTSENKTFLESKTAKILPNNPTSQGFSADQIRKSLYEGILVLFEWLKTTNNSNVDFNNKVMETLTAITENNEEDKQDLANLKQSLIDGTFNVKYLTWAIMATNDENGNRIIDTYATIERLTQVLEALTQEISDRKAADDLEKNERKEETSAIINSVNQEISDRTNAVSVLNNLITAETENRASEDEKVLQYAQSVNEALGNAKTDLQGKIDSEAQTRLTNDNEIKASITSKEDSLKALINSVKNELNGYITTLNNRVNNLPTNYVFDTYESMTNDLLNASNTKYKVGDTLFIKEVNKPDYWVSAILSTKGTYGYYELSEQESKVDLSNYVKISELSREAIEEKFLEEVENGTKSFAARSFTSTGRNSGIDVNNYVEYGYDGVSFRKNGVKYPIAFPQKDGTFALISDIPQALKNPFALTINGKVYDGSSAVSITTETITEHDLVRFWHAGIQIQNDGSEHVLRFSDFDTELEEFSPHISCQYDGPQYYWVWKFPQISGTFAMESQIPTKLSQLKNDGNYQTNTSDLKDNTTTFTTASTRSNVASGEKLSVSFGKIAKYFNDLKAVAFSGSKADIDLGNVDNTSDADKPVSNATQQALNNKANASDVYTKTETDGLLNNKANKSDVYTKIETDELLNNKANKTETDNKINKPLYNLGAYDTISGNVITRQTGYLNGKDYLSKPISKNGVNNPYLTIDNIYVDYIENIIGNCNRVDTNSWWNSTFSNVTISYDSTYKFLVIMLPNGATDTSSLNNIYIQYKLATPYTEEIIEGQPLITLDQQGSQWLRNEWERSCNLLPPSCFYPSNNIQSDGSLGTYDGYSCYYKVPVKPNTTYIASRNGGIISNDLGVAMYDSNGTFLKYVVWSGSKGTTENNVYFISFDFLSSYTNLMLNEGDHPYPYQAYNSKAHITNYEADFLKTENDRSSNLFNNPYNYSGTNNGVSINVVGNECILNGTSTEGFYKNLGSITLKAGTYTFNQVILSGSINGNMEHVKFGLYKNDNLFPLNAYKGTYTLTQDTSVDVVVWFNQAGITFNNCKLTYMLNEGTEPLPYQAYEGKVVHEKWLSDKLNNYVNKSNLGFTTFNVIRGKSQSTQINGYWAAMIKSNQYGNPTLPSDGWWHVISMDWTGNTPSNWYSQLALPTMDGGVPHYRRNDNSSGGTNIDNSTWHAFITDENISSTLSSNLKTINGNSIVGSGDLSISGTIPIYNVTQLYKHDYEIENQVGDTIYVHCWSTQNTKIKLYDITAYAFSNIQVYNTSNAEAINVLKWETSGFYYIADNGTIAGNSYTVIHYYINGEPTTY